MLIFYNKYFLYKKYLFIFKNNFVVEEDAVEVFRCFHFVFFFLGVKFQVLSGKIFE
jgi:hypothetical protein